NLTGVAVAALVVGIAAAAAQVGIRLHAGSGDGVARARSLVRQDSRFDNGPKSGKSFAEASRMRMADADRCRRRYHDADSRCAGRSAAAAYTSVTAFVLVRCTQPGIFDARHALLVELDGIASVDRVRGAAPPPAVPK